MIRLLVTLLTFVVGLAFAMLWVTYQRPAPQPVKAEPNNVSELKPTSQDITFDGGYDGDLFLTNYISSDGVGLRYHCDELKSSSRAAKELPAVNRKGIVERAPKLNDKGERVGERVVFEYTLGSHTETEIVWTEGASVFRIYAPSLKYALLFKKSQVWARKGCLNIESMRKAMRSKAQPNNSFNPTPR
jgi:hypothetical protein